MSRVEINADGRSVVVDHVGDLPYLIEQAMGAWQATDKPKRSTGFDGVPTGPKHPGLRHEPGCICTLYKAPGWEQRVFDRESGCPVHGAQATP